VSNAVIIPFVASDINPEDLPRELPEHFVVPFRPASFDKICRNSQREYPLSFAKVHLSSLLLEYQRWPSVNFAKRGHYQIVWL